MHDARTNNPYFHIEFCECDTRTIPSASMGLAQDCPNKSWWHFTLNFAHTSIVLIATVFKLWILAQSTKQNIVQLLFDLGKVKALTSKLLLAWLCEPTKYCIIMQCSPKPYQFNDFYTKFSYMKKMQRFEFLLLCSLCHSTLCTLYFVKQSCTAITCMLHKHRHIFTGENNLSSTYRQVGFIIMHQLAEWYWFPRTCILSYPVIINSRPQKKQ